MMQHELMPKGAAVTVRIPMMLRERLEARARRERRSLSAQVEYELAKALQSEAIAAPPRVRSMGRYAGGPVPTDSDFAEVRAMLWGRLGRRQKR